VDDVLDAAPCGFLSFADDGTIVMVNATLSRMLGYARAELEGRHLESVLPVPTRIFYHTHFFPLVRLHGTVEEIYLTLRSKGGEDVHVLANAARRERDGAVVNDCVFIQIRQRHRYEAEILQAKKAAEEANRAKSKFLSMMSHDLRTPLSAVTGYADILSMGIRGPVNDAQREGLRRIKDASQYLLGLLNDILDIARLDSGQVHVRVEPVPVHAALARAEELVLLRLQEAGLEYGRDGCGPETRVRADPERLQQILLNLLTNAIKFTPRGGRVSVTCKSAGDRTLVRVSDTGRGIPDDHIARIFDPFVQVDRHQNEPSQQGVGLGLAISRDLARAMDGDLTVESTVGQGSAFTLTLPSA